MKNSLLFIMFFLCPFTICAMTPVTDDELSNVAGQSGVSINADVMMNIHIDTLVWGDTNGMDWSFGWDSATNDALGTGSDGAGYFGFIGFNINSLHVRARTETNDTYGGYSLTSPILGANHLKPITIDVATGTNELPEHGVGVTFVRLGLGSLHATMRDIELPLVLGPATNNLNQSLGQIYFGDLNLYFNANSYVDIYKNPVTNSGVTFDCNVTIDKWGLTALSWGDADGITNQVSDGADFDWMTSASAGYIGLQNISKSAVTFVGSVSIDVNTATSGWYLEHEQYLFDNYLASGLGTSSTLLRPTSVTVLHLTFGENGDPFSFFVYPSPEFPLLWAIFSHGELTANVNISPYKNLTSNPALGQSLGDTKTLGDIYMSNFNFSLSRGSWIDIWAH